MAKKGNGRRSPLPPHASSTGSARTAILRCECGHSKSIHARMYANQKLGTACNYPECRCKAYRKT